MMNTSARPSCRRLAVVLMALVLFAAACGGGDLVTLDSEPSTDETTDDDAASDETAVDEAAPDGDNAGDMGSRGDTTAYCALSQDQQDREADFDFTTAGPEETRAYFVGSLAAIEDALVIAPPELQASFETVRDGFEEVVAVLAANDWDFIGTLGETVPILENSGVNEADDVIDAFDEEVCGIVDDVAATDEDSFGDGAAAFEALLETEFGRQSFAEGMAESGEITVDQAYCLVDTMDIELLFALGTGTASSESAGTAELFAAFDACGITPDQLLG